VQTTRTGNHIDVTLADGAAGGDFELLLPLARGLVGMSLVTSTRRRGRYFMLLLAPGAAAQAEALRRDVSRSSTCRGRCRVKRWRRRSWP